MCHNTLEGESEWCGQKAQCPYCQHDFVIPEATPENGTPTAPEQPPTPKKRSHKWLYISSATLFMLCLLAISSVVLAYVIPPKSTHPGAKGEQSANAEVMQKKQEVINDQKNSPSPSSAKETAKKTTTHPTTNHRQKQRQYRLSRIRQLNQRLTLHE